MPRPKRHALAVELTPYCNQRCGYCYNDWRDDPGATQALPRDTLLALLERAVTEVAFDHVTLTGGEPFARAELWDVLELLRRHGLRALIISNGGLVTDAHAARLAPFDPLFVQVTLNGPDAALHEAHVGAGQDHFHKTLRGIDALRRHGVRVGGCVVVTRRNAGVIDQILERFRSLGVMDVALSRYSPAGYAAEQLASLLPSRSELARALALAEPFARDRGMHLQVTMPVPPCLIDMGEYPHLRFASCPIGTEMQEFALGPRGELRHCTLHTASLGDPRERSFAELVSAPAVVHYRDVTPEFCAPCPHRTRCIGGCGAAAATVLGDPRGLDPIVAQHVDDVLRQRLREARGAGVPFVPLGRLHRRRSPSQEASS
jgi:radical SAM protein with 4Fe4S-binding SPASM domain